MAIFSGVEKNWTSLREKGRKLMAKRIIDQEGLVLNLDATVSSSFNSATNTLEDLSGNGNDAVLINGPEFNKNPGYLAFDGSNDYAYLKNLNYGSGSLISELTVICWARTVYNNNSNGNDGSYNSSNWALIDFDRSEVFNVFIEGGGQLKFGGDSSNNGGIGGTYYDVGAGYSSELLVNDGEWHQLAVTFSVADQAIVFYIDGKLVRSISANGSMTALGAGTRRYGFLGDGSEASSQNAGRNNVYYYGDIAVVKMYDNKALSRLDIKKDFILRRKRFGI